MRNSNEYITEMTKRVIPEHLRQVEQDHKVKVLLAVESGSRAWGFESENSDWDVRFIYVHQPEWYFMVEEQRDVIEYMYPDDVDLVGWELRKALQLLRRSNPSLLEWFNSPMIYYVEEEFAKRIKEVQNDFFSPVKSMYHYNRIYNKNNERYLQKENCPMKKFLYYLRGIFVCRWIEERKSIPPVKISDLVEAMVQEPYIKDSIAKLIELKKQGEECDILVVDDNLVEYARKWANYYNETVGSYRPEANIVSAESLDSILYDMAFELW